MSAHKDDRMPATTADDEFAALMAASSLRAPRVRALDETIPDKARRQLDAAAGAAPAGTSTGHGAADPTVKPAEDLTGEQTAHGQNSAEPVGADSALEHQRMPYALYLRHAPWSLPVDTAVTDRRLRDLRSAGWQVTRPTRLWATARTSPAPRAALWLLLAGSAPVRTAPLASLTGYSAGAHRSASVSWSASDLSMPRLSDAACLNPRRRDWSLLALSISQGSVPDFLALYRRLLKSLPPESDQDTGSDAAHEACRLPAAGNGDAGKHNAATFSRAGSAHTHWQRLLSPGCLTDLLHAPVRDPRELPHDTPPRLGEVDSGLPPHDAARWFLFCATGRPPAGHAAGVPSAVRREAPPCMDGAQTRAGTGVDQLHLLVAADLAVDLNAAHRQAPSGQPAAPPDPDTYVVSLGGRLLLPRSHADGANSNRQGGCQGVVGELADGPFELWRRTVDAGVEQYARFRMRLHGTPQDDGEPVPVQLCYRTADPFAVTAVFNHGTDQQTEWVFARELLIDGLHQSAGIGDVVVWPSPDEPSGRQRIFIRLRPPEGEALLSAARDAVEAFLDASHPLTRDPQAAARAWAPDVWESTFADIKSAGTDDSSRGSGRRSKFEQRRRHTAGPLGFALPVRQALPDVDDAF
ncbi:SsgA family sporulation/cell division regulator [Streptomyces sp. NPDC005017]|uniref:SsgA family sporulation/cell division regulator n=1 Tax=Streptomyces sp. NPDC005017 TaxID=3364706 RepID=UPI00367996D9